MKRLPNYNYSGYAFLKQVYLKFKERTTRYRSIAKDTFNEAEMIVKLCDKTHNCLTCPIQKPCVKLWDKWQDSRSMVASNVLAREE